MDSLRQHMRDHLIGPPASDPTGNVLKFRQPPLSSAAGAVLALVTEAAELMRSVEKDAAERQARAEALVARAIEQLKLAKERVQAADAQRCEAEARVEEFTVRIREVGTALEHANCQIVAAEAQITMAEERAKLAEKRAAEAESQFKRIETAIRTQILERGSNGSSSAAAVA